MSGLRRIVCGYAGTYEVVRLVETSARVDSGVEEREAGVVEPLAEVALGLRGDNYAVFRQVDTGRGAGMSMVAACDVEGNFLVVKVCPTDGFAALLTDRARHTNTPTSCPVCC